MWINISSGQSCNLPLSNVEYKLMKEVFHYFAERTSATCRQVLDAESYLHLLAKHKIQKYFTRAVISLLLYNPDVYGQFVRDIGGIPNGDNTRSRDPLQRSRAWLTRMRSAITVAKKLNCVLLARWQSIALKFVSENIGKFTSTVAKKSQ